MPAANRPPEYAKYTRKPTRTTRRLETDGLQPNMTRLYSYNLQKNYEVIHLPLICFLLTYFQLAFQIHTSRIKGVRDNIP